MNRTIKKNKVILYLIDSLNEGGAQSLILEYAHNMKDRYEIIVVTIYNNGTDIIDRLREEVSVDTIYIKRNLFTRTFNKVFGRWYIPYKLKKIIQNRKPNVIHAHLMVLQYLKKVSEELKGIRLFYTSHSQPERNFKGSRRGEGEAARYLIKHNDLTIVALHEDMKNEINAMFEIDSTILIKNGVNIKGIRDTSINSDHKRRNLYIPVDSYIVGHIGRFIKIKNHKFIIEIFLEILKKKPNAFLLLVGTGELLDNIKEEVVKKGIGGRTLILSNRRDIAELLYIMDVFIFPSYLEGLSIALLEAQAAGLRIIVSDKVNYANFLSQRIVPMSLDKSAEEWAGVALDENILNSTYGNLEDYDIDNVIKDMEHIYFDIEQE